MNMFRILLPVHSSPFISKVWIVTKAMSKHFIFGYCFHLLNFLILIIFCKTFSRFTYPSTDIKNIDLFLILIIEIWLLVTLKTRWYLEVDDDDKEEEYTNKCYLQYKYGISQLTKIISVFIYNFLNCFHLLQFWIHF